MTSNDAWSVFWSRGWWRVFTPNASTLYVGKHVGEDSDITRADETIGYLVIEAGSGSIGARGYVAALGGDSIRGGQRAALQLQPERALVANVAIASEMAMDDANGGWAVLYGSDPVSATQPPAGRRRRSGRRQRAQPLDGAGELYRVRVGYVRSLVFSAVPGSCVPPGGSPDFGAPVASHHIPGSNLYRTLCAYSA